MCTDYPGQDPSIGTCSYSWIDTVHDSVAHATRTNKIELTRVLARSERVKKVIKATTATEERENKVRSMREGLYSWG